MQALVKLPDGVKIGPFINQMMEMNGYPKYIPCLRDEEGLPSKLV